MENVRDREDRGRRVTVRGEANGRAVVPDTEAVQIVGRVLSGESLNSDGG